MTEETAQPSSEPAAAPSNEVSTLDQVYQTYGIEDQAAEFKPQSQQPVAQPVAAPAFKAPDPFDPNFQAYQSQLAQGVSTLHQSLAQLAKQQTEFQQTLQREKTEADIKQAVGKISEKAGLDPSIAEVALEAKARQDPKFLQIWNNRAKNPKAFDAALSAVSNEFREKFTVKQDPQLVENQRAVAASRNSMATTQKQGAQDEWADMTPQERQNKVRMLIARG